MLLCVPVSICFVKRDDNFQKFAIKCDTPYYFTFNISVIKSIAFVVFQIWVQVLVSPLAILPWRREWLPTPVFLPGEFRGQRSPVG